MTRSWIMAGIIVLMTCGPAWGQQPSPYDDRPRITVNGDAVVNVRPDKIVINLGVETSDLNILAAKEKNNQILIIDHRFCCVT